MHGGKTRKNTNVFSAESQKYFLEHESDLQIIFTFEYMPV